jgi:hypothetical protein
VFYRRYRGRSIGQGVGRLSCFLLIMAAKGRDNDVNSAPTLADLNPEMGNKATQRETAGKPGRLNQGVSIGSSYFAAVGKGFGLSESEFR